MKGCSASLVIRELQIKTTIKSHYTPTRMIKIKRTECSKCWLGWSGIGTSITTGGKVNGKNAPENTPGQFLKTLSVSTPYN